MTQDPRLPLESLSTPHLLNLLRNSRLKGYEATAALVEQVLEARRSGRALPPAGGFGSTSDFGVSDPRPRRGRMVAISAAALLLTTVVATTALNVGRRPQPPIYLQESLGAPPPLGATPHEAEGEARPQADASSSIDVPSRSGDDGLRDVQRVRRGHAAPPPRPPARVAELVTSRSFAPAPPPVTPPLGRAGPSPGPGGVLAISTTPGLVGGACADRSPTSAQMLCEDDAKARRIARMGTLTPPVRGALLRPPGQVRGP
jgi:hypothetical protein